VLHLELARLRPPGSCPDKIEVSQLSYPSLAQTREPSSWPTGPLQPVVIPGIGRAFINFHKEIPTTYQHTTTAPLTYISLIVAVGYRTALATRDHGLLQDRLGHYAPRLCYSPSSASSWCFCFRRRKHPIDCPGRGSQLETWRLYNIYLDIELDC
jgi:hypothetical protein